MTSQWRVLDLSTFEGAVSSERGQIEICPRSGEVTRLPVSDIAVVIVGIRVSLSAAVIHRLTSVGIPVLFCDWRGVPESAAYPWSEHTRVGARHQAQASMSIPRAKNAWGRIVSAKIRGQAQVLKNLGVRGGGELHALASAVHSGDPQNCEARAARLYWKALNLPDGRTAGAGYGLNGCLDYGYTILRGHGIRAVLAAGLTPALGFFHHNRSNMFALVDDLMEPFRPCIDELVFSLGDDASVSDRETKHQLVAAASQAFHEDGTTVPTVFLEFAQHVGMYVEGNLERLNVPTWVGPSAVVERESHG